LAKVTDPAGRELTFAYNEGGQIESATEPEGLTVEYGYEEGNLSEVIDIGGGRWHYTYDGAHHLLTEEDPREHVILTNTYDGAGRVETQKDGRNRETAFAYGNSETTVTSSEGNQTRDIYEGGLLTEKIEGLGTEDEATWHYAYDPVTLGKTSATDPNGHTTTMEYNSAGDLTSIKDPLGHETYFEYDELNDRTRVTDAESISTTLTYDEKGNLTETSTPRGGEHQIWKYAHENGSHPGDVTKVTDPDAHATILGYNADGDLTSIEDPEGDETTFEYDEGGHRTKMVSPLGNAEEGEPSKHATSYEVGPFGDVERIVDPLKGETLFGYDGDRNLTSITDPDGNKTTRIYDEANELSEIKRADTTVLKNGYDEDGNLEFQTDGAGKASGYDYDPLDRLESVTDPLSRKTEYLYDPAGNLTELIDPLERTTSYGYDEANRLESIKYSDGETPEATFGYDQDNQRTLMTDGTGESTFAYNSLHQLTEATQQGTTVGFGYDLADNETSIVYPGSHEVTRAFDKANRLESVTDWTGNKTSFGYDADSNLTSTTFPTGTTNVDKYGYDPADRLSSVAMKKGEATAASLTYKRDPVGQLEKEEQTGLPGAASTSFGYTALNQLSSAGSSAYAYSSADNPIKLAGANGYEYDEANELEATPSGAPGGPATLSYNSLGERTELNPETGPTIEYAYDQAGRLTSVGSESHAYAGDGLRLSTTTGAQTQHFSWDRNGGVPLLLTDGSTRYIYGPGGLPVEQVSAGGTATYYHHDQLGSTRMLTNSSGEAKGSFSYAPYGALAASSGEQTTPLGYAGQYTDPVSGLQYLRARYYDPATGQFVTRDPLVEITQAPYNYASNNPLNHTDPSGLCNTNPFSGGFWTEGNCLSESPFNPITYYKEEIEAIEDGCSYLEAVSHGVKGAFVLTADAAGVLLLGAEAAPAALGTTDYWAEQFAARYPRLYQVIVNAAANAGTRPPVATTAGTFFWRWLEQHIR
jgi:RHS repeat-associated protein